MPLRVSRVVRLLTVGVAACGLACSRLPLELGVVEKAKVEAEVVLLPGVAGPAVAFSPDGRMLTTGSWNKRVHLWEVDTWREVGTLETITDMVKADFSPNGRWLVLEGRTYGPQGRMGTEVWDMVSRQKKLDLPAPFSLQGDFLAVVGIQERDSTPTIRILQVGTWRELPGLPVEGRLLNLVSSSKNRRLAVTSMKIKRQEQPNKAAIQVLVPVRYSATPAQTEVRIVELPDLREVSALPPNNVALALSHDGLRLATLAGKWWWEKMPMEGTVKLWEVASAQEVRALGSRRVAAAAFSPDGRFLAVGGSGDLDLWEVHTGKKRTHGTHPTAIAFSPDGRFLAAGTGKTILLWDVATDRVQLLPGGGYGHTHIEIAFSPDSRWLAVGISQDAVRVWDVQKLAAKSQ